MRRFPVPQFAVGALLAAAVYGCGNTTNPGANPSGTKKAPVANDGDDDGDDGDDDSTAHGSVSSGSGSGGCLKLTTGPGFDTVSGFLSTNCSSCHPGTGGTLDYRKYEDVKSDAANILARIKKGKDDMGFMPPGGNPDTAEITKFQAWIDGGKLPESQIVGGTTGSGCGNGISTDDGVSTSTTVTAGTTTTGAATTGSSTAAASTTTGSTTTGSTTGAATGPDPTFLDGIVNPAKKAICHTSKQPFVRSSATDGGDCLTTARLVDKTTDGFECNRAGIVGKVTHSGVAAALDAVIAQGKTFDECGITSDGKTLIVWMFCLSNVDGATPPACVAQDQLTTTTIYPKTSKLQIPYP